MSASATSATSIVLMLVSPEDTISSPKAFSSPAAFSPSSPIGCRAPILPLLELDVAGVMEEAGVASSSVDVVGVMGVVMGVTVVVSLVTEARLLVTPVVSSVTPVVPSVTVSTVLSPHSLHREDLGV